MIEGYRLRRVVEVPSDPEAPHHLVATLGGIHAVLGTTGGTLAAAWIRPPGDPTLWLLYGGGTQAAGSGSHDGHLLLPPPGAVAEDVDRSAVAALLARFPHWVACTPHSDALWAADPDATPRVGVFDAIVARLSQPFAWLVLAEPVDPAGVDAELAALGPAILPLTHAVLGEPQRVALERLQARYRELSRARHGDCWRLRLLAGGVDEPGAMLTAGLLCAASDLGRSPYRLVPGGRGTDAGVSVVTTPLVAALVRPPDRELPGIRVVEPHTFDLTCEPGLRTGLHLGAVLDAARESVDAMRVSHGALNRHVFVSGATGSGKSQTVRHLLAQATQDGLPWLAIEPVKAEYARMAARGAEVVVVRPQDAEAPPAGLNPLEPAPGFGLQTHIDLFRALFLAAFEAQEPFPQILTAALERCYDELGWDVTLSEPRAGGGRRYPVLGDLQRAATQIVAEVGYGPEVSANVHGFITVRLGSLRMGSVGRFFEGGHPIDFARLRSRNVVMELEDIGDDRDKAFVIGAVLIRLVEHLRVRHRDGHPPGLAHVTVVEEAHRLLRQAPRLAGPAAHAVEMFAALLAEVRAYGEGLIVVEQIPSKIIPDVIKNTAVKITHRLPADDDRASVGATMNLGAQQSRFLVTLPPGEAVVFCDGADRPLLVRVPDGTTAESGHPPAPAAVRDIIGRRSATCGTACQREPCTLRTMRTAQRLLDAVPWLALWAELAALAHLAGHPTATPADDLLRTLPDLAGDLGTLDCALAHAADAAAAVRARELVPEVSVDDLATHLVATLRGAVRGEPSRCHRDDLRYLATVFRWERPRLALAAAPPGYGPHPRTPEWEKQYGRRLPGATPAEQLATVTDWLAADFGDRARRDTVTFGSQRPSTLERAVGCGSSEPRWPALVDSALTAFPDSGWALIHLLLPDPPGQG